MEKVNKIHWWEIYSSNDVDLALDIFTKKLTDILDRMAPIRKFLDQEEVCILANRFHQRQDEDQRHSTANCFIIWLGSRLGRIQEVEK